MQCPRCQHENSPKAKFCEECATSLVRTCSNCGTHLSPTAKFCPECARPGAAQPRFASPGAYTPQHLAEKILKAAPRDGGSSPRWRPPGAKVLVWSSPMANKYEHPSRVQAGRLPVFCRQNEVYGFWDWSLSSDRLAA